MDGGEEDFLSGTRSDDGGGTPVLDEPRGSDGEDMRSDRHPSEDDGSNDEDAPNATETGGTASGSDHEDHRGGADSDSEGDAPGGRHGNNDKSDSETEAPRRVDSDDGADSPVKRRMSGSDNEEESPVKHGASDNEEAGRSSPAKRRGSSSDLEEGGGGRGERPRAAADSDSDNQDAKPAASPKRRSNADSDSETETPARRKAAQIDSEEEEEKQQGEEEGGGGGGKWKAVMQSDSDEEEDEGRRKKAATGSDGEQQEEKEQRDDSEDDEKPVKRKKAILSDSEDEEKADKPAVKRSRAVSDDDNSDSDGGLAGGPDKSLAAKLRELGSDSGSEEDERSKATPGKKDEKALFGSDSESGDGEEEEKMIADIFGESGDEEEEEFTGFNQEDLEGDKKESKGKQEQVEEESDSDEGVDRSGQDTSFMSDFDIMLARRKAMNSKKRRHRDGGTFISDADDVVSAMITKMNEAAEEDRTLNSQKKPALKKLTLLPQVVMHLKKQDLKETFIDSGVMSAIKEWISPLPDKSLPALRIREELLRILQELPSVSQETLKHSGIGRSVMFLYKHPKESRSNKDLALKLINEWSRPIFGLTSNYKGMTREERQQRDLDQQMPQRRRLSQPPKVERAEEPDVFSPPISSGGQTPRRDLEKQLTGEEKALRPGDPGFCARARVPMPSNKDYVVRPKWNVEVESNRGPMKKGLSRVDKQMRRIADIRRLTKPGHAVKISVEGNRMPL
ncbi:protein IWS1 homolog isoform X1 [Dicentrarchus labrax]|uniref:protein IWS1 homolog isoform X1 n=1 Tax=Dicentrarchus labrax TaxID=13489 RepID=UPI0021F5C4CC|nr:protein IWS1 homolog isoform X1 [Dicentrarchus labrax]